MVSSCYTKQASQINFTQLLWGVLGFCFFSYGNYRLGSEKDTKAEWRLLGKRKGMGAHKKIVKETEKSTLYKEENGTVKPVIL